MDTATHAHVDSWKYFFVVVVLNFENRIRQNLREKHARHIADLRAYYDSEIQSLKQQLEASHRTASSEDLEKINQNLADRYCLLIVLFLCDMVFFLL